MIAQSLADYVPLTSLLKNKGDWYLGSMGQTAGERKMHETEKFQVCYLPGEKERLVFYSLQEMERLTVGKRDYKMSEIFSCQASGFWDWAEL